MLDLWIGGGKLFRVSSGVTIPICIGEEIENKCNQNLSRSLACVRTRACSHTFEFPLDAMSLEVVDLFAHSVQLSVVLCTAVYTRDGQSSSPDAIALHTNLGGQL